MEIRGVQGAGVLKTLLDRKLIATAGRKNVVGKPILYKTTREFLVQFGLKDLSELPTLKEFQEIGRLDTETPDDANRKLCRPAPLRPQSTANLQDPPSAERNSAIQRRRGKSLRQLQSPRRRSAGGTQPERMTPGPISHPPARPKKCRSNKCPKNAYRRSFRPPASLRAARPSR